MLRNFANMIVLGLFDSYVMVKLGGRYIYFVNL